MREPRRAETPSETHNRVAPRLIRDIVMATIGAGGTGVDAMVLLESVAAGVLVAVTRTGGEMKVLETFQAGVAIRYAEINLGPLAPKGNS